MQNDLFNGASHPVAAHYDLFTGKQIDSFRWIVAQFAANGATYAIIKANKVNLLTYFPIRVRKDGRVLPLWWNYLFIEARHCVTIDLCRNTPYFIRIISVDSQPVLVRREAINDSLQALREGKFNDVEVKRPFYGRGSKVLVKDGSFSGKHVTIQIDIVPSMNGRVSVPVDINGHKATIELFKLAL